VPAAQSQRHGEAAVPIFIGRGAPLRATFLNRCPLAAQGWRIDGGVVPVEGAHRAGRRQLLYFRRHNMVAAMNVAVTTAAEGFPRRALTVDDISRMIAAGVIHEDEKFELIEGEIVMMAAKGIAHERIKSALTVAISRALPDDLTIGVEATLRLTNMIRVEPDVAVFPRSCSRNRRRLPSSTPVRPI
jgi:Putative restriction endonuclease